MTLPRGLVTGTAGVLLLMGATVVAAQAVQSIDPLQDPGHRTLVSMVAGALVTAIVGVWTGLRVIKTLRDDFVALAAEEGKRAAGAAVAAHNAAEDAHAVSRADILQPILDKLTRIEREQSVISALLVERVKNVDRRIAALEAAVRAGVQGHAADGRRLDALEDGEGASGDSSDDSFEPLQSTPRRDSDPDGADYREQRTHHGQRIRGRG